MTTQARLWLTKEVLVDRLFNVVRQGFLDSKCKDDHA